MGMKFFRVKVIIGIFLERSNNFIQIHKIHRKCTPPTIYYQVINFQLLFFQRHEVLQGEGDHGYTVFQGNFEPKLLPMLASYY